MSWRNCIEAEPMPGLPELADRRTALIVGYAADARGDVERALLARPDAVMLGAKYACVMFPQIKHVWTQHPEQASEIKDRAGQHVYVHTRRRLRGHKAKRTLARHKAHIDYVWPKLHWVCGSSGFATALWARHGLGFQETILCGVPLEAGGYAPEIAGFKTPTGDGGNSFIDTRVLLAWRDLIATYVRDGIASGIVSMSGWTRSTLGAPTC
jgi:hypothetical protein